MAVSRTAWTAEWNTLLSAMSGYGRECLVRMTPGGHHLNPVIGILEILREIILLVQIGRVQPIQEAKRGKEENADEKQWNERYGIHRQRFLNGLAAGWIGF